MSATNFVFDPHRVPVSLPGSFLALNFIGDLTPPWHRREAEAGLYLRSIRYGSGQNFLLHIVPLDNNGKKMTEYAWQGTAGTAFLKTDAASMALTFQSPEEIIIESNGMGFLLVGTPAYFNYVREIGAGKWRYNVSSMRTALDIDGVQGVATLDAPWNATHNDHIRLTCLPDQEGVARLHVREVAFQAPYCPIQERPRGDQRKSFDSWAAPLVGGLDDIGTATLAAHCLWINQAGPFKELRGNAILASKAWMASAYSWDCCFHALGILTAYPELAWNQIAIFFEAQAEDGSIPNLIQPDHTSYNFMLPPIQGWTLRPFLKSGLLNSEQIAWLYPRLALWTRWWLARDEDNDGVPQYNHGNDSGWDNGSAFADGIPIESPDLLVYLALQCDALQSLAVTLNKNDEAEYWRTESERLVGLLISHFWNGARFVPCHSGSHKPCPGDSLLSLMPIMLGLRLPPAIRESLIAAIKDTSRFLHPFGLSTEALNSSYYSTDSYWRGCVWPSPTWLIIQGLEDCGETILACEIAKRFMKACAASGMAENFDPITGQGWRDLHYGWAAAVYLLCTRFVKEHSAYIK